ncbi:MAG: hypothetical protein QXS62_07050 [Sulfolobales archaeon]
MLTSVLLFTVFGVCVVGHYEMHYRRLLILALLFDTYTLFTLAFRAGTLLLSA